MQDVDQLPLFPAIILIFDQIMDPDVFNIFELDLDRQVRRQNVLLVLISDDGPKVPICSDKIWTRSLDTARPDTPSSAVGMIRVPLDTTIHFIANL